MIRRRVLAESWFPTVIALLVLAGCAERREPEDDDLGAASQALTGYEPDLVVFAVSGPPSALPGGGFNASITVCNQGMSWSPWTSVEVRLSEDATITMSDVFIGSAPLGGLDQGQCAEVVVPVGAWVPDGEYTLGAIVDPYDNLIELVETNNATAGGELGVGYGPDLFVSSVTAPSSAQPGSWIGVSATVCNHGTTPSYGTDLEVRFSSDAEITQADFPAGFAPVPDLPPGGCADVVANANTYMPEGAYFAGAIVDANGWMQELIETNNATAGDLVGVGYQPDLIVSAVSGPPSVQPGMPFDAFLTVCNQGTTPSYYTDLELRLSSDAEITQDDFLAGFAPVQPLPPGQCATVTVPANAYVPEGAYHLGAVVDPNDWITELVESNNAATGTVVGIGFRPDLVVSAVSGPPSVQPGMAFNASMTVCNQGTTPSYYTDLALRLSSDATITQADFPAGFAPVQPLDPGQCATVTAPANAYGPEGAYYLGAIVDPNSGVQELIETNNATAGTVMGIGLRPDLIVSAVSGPPSVQPGMAFSASLTVCNQGTTPSYYTDLALRLSSDAAITQADFPAGFAPVQPLDPGQCTTVTAPANAYVPEGAYYLGGIVDPNSGVQELIETNNATAGTVMGIGFRPDLIVSTVSGPPSVQPGMPFDASVTVCNQGTTPSYYTDLELRLSSDAAITQADFPAGFAPVQPLDPGQCTTVTVPANAYVPEGAYHLGGIVDPNGTVQELIETNNASAGTVVGIGLRPDLIVSAVSGPPSLQPGTAFNASLTVCNQGTTPSYSTDLALRLSSDATITQADFPAGFAPVQPLDPGQCATVTAPANAYGPEGAYFLGAIVDPNSGVQELIETNNATAGTVMGIGFRPDLIVSTVSGPPSAQPGMAFNASLTVCNQGTTPSYYTDLELRLSSDAAIAQADFPAGFAPVQPLDPGQCATVTAPANAYVPEGAYYLGGIVDPNGTVQELIETNNATAGTVMGIGLRPDLIVSAVSGPPSVQPGMAFNASLTVCNQGTTPSYYTDLELRLSSDATITQADIPAGFAPVQPLDPGQCATVTVPANAYGPEGAYHLGGIVDPNGTVQELIETNNATAGTVMGIGLRPDLIVSAVSGPPSVQPGMAFNASLTVCNQGTTPSYYTDLTLRLSPDATITQADLPAGFAPVQPLDPGQCATVTAPANAYGPEGAYFLGAIVDPNSGVQELIETNNATAGTVMGIGLRPDLIVSTVSGPSSVQPGTTFEALVTVCNQGTTPSYYTDLALRLSSDAAITQADFPAGFAPVQPLDPGQCATVTAPANAYVPEGAYYLGGIVDPNGTVQELIETNNATAGTVVGIGLQPDLIVSAVSGPPSVQPGMAFSASLTVCNQGTTPSYYTDLELRLSSDATITQADLPAGFAPVQPLDPGQCATVTVPANAYGPEGAYFLGAIVDPNGTVQEPIETNNAAAGGSLGIGYRPDLIVSAVSAPSSVQPGTTFEALVTVCNQGTTPSYGTNVDVLLSSDESIAPPDFPAGGAPVPWLGSGDCATLTVLADAYVPFGSYVLGAIVDRNMNVLELIETNNTKAGSPLTVTY